MVAVRGGFESAFPEDDDIPAGFAPELLMFLIAADVIAELRVPEDLVGLRRGRLRTHLGLHKFASVPLPAVMMPEAPADLDQRLQARQHDVGMSDETLVAHAEPVAVREEPLADDHLRQRIPALDRLHALAPLFWSKLIHAAIISQKISAEGQTLRANFRGSSAALLHHWDPTRQRPTTYTL